jgi:hypothetical protein
MNFKLFGFICILGLMQQDVYANTYFLCKGIKASDPSLVILKLTKSSGNFKLSHIKNKKEVATVDVEEGDENYFLSGQPLFAESSTGFPHIQFQKDPKFGWLYVEGIEGISISFECNEGVKGILIEERIASIPMGKRGNKSFKCRFCQQNFRKKGEYNLHLKEIHNGVKAHACPTCNKSFDFEAPLRRHMATHQENKPYVCPICDRSFTQAHTLTLHIQIHTGQTPHQCPHCSYSTGFRSNLKVHIRVKHLRQ